MRCVAGVGLVALVGCNQLFSLAPTREFDAAVSRDVIEDMPHIELTYQLAGVLPSGDAASITFPPLVPAPLVKYAPLLPGQPMASLIEGKYSPGGQVEIPRDYLVTPWRLEYIVTDGVSSTVPHEVQWLPDDKKGHIAVPLFGRLAVDQPSNMAGYKVKPNGALPFVAPQVISTGLWTAGTADIDPTSSTTVSYELSHATLMSGKVGLPDPALGDRAYLVDVATDAQGCQFAVGSVFLNPAAVQIQTVMPSTRTTQVPSASWDAQRNPVATGGFDLKLIGRLQNKLGNLHTAVTGTVLFGYAPSLGMPGLAALRRPTSLPLPVPVMAPLLQCPYSPNPGDGHPGVPPDTARPGGLSSFPQILHIQLVDPRTVLGVTLSSGMETVLTSVRLPSNELGFAITFPAAIPAQPMLATPTKGTIDLAGDSEQVDVGPAGGVFQLSFTSETSTADFTVRADYHDILLHHFESAMLVTDRIYTVTAPTVQIDGSLLRPDTTYVFEIRTYKGHTSAAHGDFTAIDYPYGAAIVFTRTFKTAP